MREKMKKESTITIRKCLSATLCTFLIITGFSAAVPVQARLFEGIKLQSSAKKASKSNAKMLKVVLPTETEHVFDFIMDPEGLIYKTDGAAYDYSSFEEDASVFFRRSDGESDMNYSRFSDSLTIINRGKEPIEIELTAKISPSTIDGIVLAGNEEFIDDSPASLYLALTDGETTVAIDEEEGAVIHATLEGSSDGDEFSSYSFQLTGAVNPYADWSKLKDAKPKVTVTWKVSAEEEDEPEEDIQRAKQVFESENLESSTAERNGSESLSSDRQENRLEETKEEPKETLPTEDERKQEGEMIKGNKPMLATPSTVSK